MYTLMNKDKRLLDFEIIGTSSLERCKICRRYDKLPFWITETDAGISQWIENRSAAKHRRHIQEILNKCGGYTKSGFIELTHCLSLNDTLWMKKDSEQVCWNEAGNGKRDKGALENMRFGWINWINAAVVAILIGINLIAVKKGIAGRMESRWPLVNIFEQIGRYSCMALMVVPLAAPGLEFGFYSVEAALLWQGATIVLLLAYGVLWMCKKSCGRLVLYGLAIVPVGIFLINGILLHHFLLAAAAILFGVCHVLIVIENR